MSRNELRKEWEQRIAAFRASGQTATQWCADHDVNLYQFRYWLRKFPSRRVETISPIQWLPVHVDDAPAQDMDAASITVCVGHAKIEIKPGFSPELLRQVVQVLTASC